MCVNGTKGQEKVFRIHEYAGAGLPISSDGRGIGAVLSEAESLRENVSIGRDC